MSSLQPAWTGLLQAAFKHQSVVQGVNDTYYVRRPDIQLPVPPITTIDVSYEAVANLRDIYAIDAEGNLYVLGDTPRVEEMGERKVITLPGVGYGDADDDGLIDHELGTFFYGNISLAPDGRILAVSNLPSFFMFDGDGNVLLNHAQLRAGEKQFEAPPEGAAPFWQVGAGDVATGPEGFVVGGAPLHRVDHYTYEGKLLASIRHFEHGGRQYDLEAEKVAKVCFDRNGHILASTQKYLFVFDGTGAIVDVWVADDAAGVAGDFHLWIGVGADRKLWSQHYRGKEVAYAAFQLP